MSWSWTLYRYLGRQFLIGVGIIFGAFLLLGFSIDVVELFRRTATKDVAAATIFGMALLKLPDLGQKLLPFAVLLGGILSFTRLSRSHELVAARAAGVSVWEFLAPPLIVAAGLGVLTMIAYNPFSSSMLSQYERLEAKHVRGQASQLAVSKTGLWLRQGDGARQSVVHALRGYDQGVRLEDAIFILFRAQDEFVGRIEARTASLEPGKWSLSEAWVSGPDGAPEHHANYELPTTLTPAQIKESFASPDTVSFWELPRFITNAEDAGFSAVRHRLYWYSLMTLPVLFAAMVFMAASFSLRLTRLGGLPQLVLLAALSGFAVYFFSDLTEALGISGILPAPLAAAAPALAAILIGMTLLFHQEDG